MAVTISPYLDFGSLVEGLGDGVLQMGDEPVPLPVVVPSVGFGDELRRQIAGEYGICMGLDLQTAQTFLGRVLRGVEEGPWTRRRLVWQILARLADLKKGEGPLAGMELSRREEFAWADLLADRFDQYGYWRPAMVREWAAGREVGFRVEELEMRAAQAWQRELFSQIGEGQPHPAIELARLFGEDNFVGEIALRYPRVLVLGTGSLSPLLVDLLGVLGEAGSEVSVRLILPSLEYLGDLHGRKKLPAVESLPEEFNEAAGHPLLETMGQQAVGGFLLLGKLDEGYGGWPELGEAGRAGEVVGGSLLERLQGDVRALRAPRVENFQREDWSLRVHGCFGVRREMECLRDEILRAFAELPDLQPEEVLIAAPSLEEYRAVGAGIFAEAGLPVRWTELSVGEGDALGEAVLSLLGMVHRGRYPASEFLEFIRLRAVREKLGFEEDGFWHEGVVADWLAAAGLTHGLGGEEAEFGSWRFALDRLLGGYWLGEDRAQRYPGQDRQEGEFVLPFGGGEDGLKLEEFLVWWGGLRAAIEPWGQPTSPAGWAARMEGVARECLCRETEAMEELSAACEMLRQAGAEVEIDAGALYDWLGAEFGPGNKRALISGQIAFGRLKQLQNLPCRVWAVVGMQEGNFPASSRLASWDLLAGNPCWWDRNPTRDDRQLFLDGLLTAKERVVITASNRDPRSGKTEPFSSCVEELLRVTEQMGVRRKDLVVEHALQPYRREYFAGGSDWPPSFDPVAAEVVKEWEESPEGVAAPFWSGKLLGCDGVVEELKIGELIGFWKNPARGFLRAQGLRLSEVEEGDERWDQSPLELGALELWSAKRAWVEAELLGKGASEHWRAKLQAERGLPPGELGRSQWQGLRRECGDLVEALREVWGEEKSLECVVQLSTGASIRLVGKVRQTQDATEWLAWTPGALSAARHFLGAWVESLLAAAAGEVRPLRFCSSEARGLGVRLPEVDSVEARRILSGLAEGCWIGRQRPLPFGLQASEVLAKELAKGSGVDGALAAARREWEKADRRYGLGEGQTREAQLAWRDREVWAEVEMWVEWAERVSKPLLEWRSEK